MRYYEFHQPKSFGYKSLKAQNLCLNRKELLKKIMTVLSPSNPKDFQKGSITLGLPKELFAPNLL